MKDPNLVLFTRVFYSSHGLTHLLRFYCQIVQCFHIFLFAQLMQEGLRNDVKRKAIFLYAKSLNTDFLFYTGVTCKFK